MEKRRAERILEQKKDMRLKNVKQATKLAGTTMLFSTVALQSFASQAQAATTDQVDINSQPTNTTNQATSQVPQSNQTSDATQSSVSAENNSGSENSETTVSESSNAATSENTTAQNQPAATQKEESVAVSKVKPQSANVYLQSDNIRKAISAVNFRSMTPQAFINSVSGYARQLANDNDLYASVMIAQASLESGFGGSTLGSAPNYNLFGIKGNYNGNSVMMWTQEDDGHGNLYWIKTPFRKYPSYYQSLQDYVKVLKNTNFGAGPYYKQAWKSQTNSYQDATAYLQGHYATATNYAASLNRLIQQYNLTQFDTHGSNNGNNSNNNNNNSGNNNQTPSGKTYTVKSGDSVWGIAHKFGVSMSDLVRWNNIKNNLIHPGQVLKLSNTNQQPNKPSQPSNPGNTKTYTVKSGDSLWAIAMKFNMSVNQIKQLNSLHSDLILVGQVLKVNA